MLRLAAAVAAALVSLPSPAIEAYKAQEVPVYRGSGTIEPYRGQQVKPQPPQEVPVYRGSGTIEPYRGQQVKPQPPARQGGNDQQGERPTPAQQSGDLSVLFGLWQTNIPGAVYTVPSGFTGYDRLVVSSGAVSGLFQLDANGRLAWNSYGEAKRGRWVRTNDSEYPLEIIDTYEKRRWKVGFDPRKQIIRLWDGYVWYEGRRAQIGGRR